jgi:maleate isomerase
MSGSRRRARIGVTIPSTNTSVEADYNELAPAGVSFHVARIFINNSIDSDDKARETLRQIREGNAKAVHDVMTCSPDHLVLGMSSETFVGGLEGSRELTRTMEEMSGLKVTTGSDATRAALESIGAKRIGVLTPYQPWIDSQVAQYFDDLGYHMVAMRSLRCPTAISIAETTDDEILDKIDELAHDGEVDAFVQAGTNLSSYRLADEVERLHGKPLIAINAATVAHALMSCGVDDPLPAAGRVFAKPLAA